MNDAAFKEDALDAQKVSAEKKQIYHDLYDGLIPKRIPISGSINPILALEYSNLPAIETFWTLKGYEEALDKICRITTPIFNFPLGGRSAAYFHILNNQTNVMGARGLLQHPDVRGFEEDEYDEFIKSPYEYIMETIMPRLNPALNSNPITSSLIFAKAMIAKTQYNANTGAIIGRLMQKYGFYQDEPGINGGSSAPFDYIADQFRSFSGICSDVRRVPEKLAEACDAVLPMIKRMGTPFKPSPYGRITSALHMAPYLREKDFEKLYWPSFYRLIHSFAQDGSLSNLFCEHDWMRYLDHLYELPANTALYFEYGDLKTIKEKLGRKHIIQGAYPLTYLKTATKQQSIDKAKEIIDILAPGGKYIFSFDKDPISLSDVNLENYAAVLEFVAEYGKYDNAGTPAASEGIQYKQPDIEPIAPFESKYFMTWEQYKQQSADIPEGMEDIIKEVWANGEASVFAYGFRI